MARELKAVDISDTPELLRLAEEVRATREPRLLRRDREDIAVLMPVFPTRRRRAPRTPTKADEEAFLSSAGSWKDFDAEAFKAYIRERRDASSRPPVEL